MTFPKNIEYYMQRCLDLAVMAEGHTSPNPMVGAVILHKDIIIGEGYHKKAGMPHAEVEAIRSVKPEHQHLIKDSSLYVSLEPCCHHGKTPPCTDLILQHQIPEVIVGIKDPSPKVGGKGIALLRENGLKVTVPVLEDNCRSVNKRFFSVYSKKRPYIILKWAQTANGYFAPLNHSKQWITSDAANYQTHLWRSKEDAILVGTKTAMNDNPSLDVRHVPGNNPVRLVIDENLTVPESNHVYKQTQPTIIFNKHKQYKSGLLQFVKIDFTNETETQILDSLLAKNILSVIIEGGAFTLQKFIDKNLWDEARVWSSHAIWETGIPAPVIRGTQEIALNTGKEVLIVYQNTEKS